MDSNVAGLAGQKCGKATKSGPHSTSPGPFPPVTVKKWPSIIEITLTPGSMDYAVGDAHDLTTARDAKYLTGGVEGQTFDLASTNGGVVAFVVNRDGFQVALDLHGGPGGVGTIRGNGVVNLTDDQWAAMNGMFRRSIYFPVILHPVPTANRE